MMNTLRLILPAIALLISVSTWAQTAINRVIDANSAREDVEVSYNECRGSDHRVYSETIVLSFNDPELYRRLEDAFNQERENTVQASRQTNSMIFKFRDDNGGSVYMLRKEADNSGLLIKRWNAIRGDGSAVEAVEDAGFFYQPWLTVSLFGGSEFLEFNF